MRTCRLVVNLEEAAGDRRQGGLAAAGTQQSSRPGLALQTSGSNPAPSGIKPSSTKLSDIDSSLGNRLAKREPEEQT